MKFNLLPISEKDRVDLACVYKFVFAGHPWHEDMICASVKSEDPAKRCMVQYTAQTCEAFDHDSDHKPVNDCRGYYAQRQKFSERSGIVHLNGSVPDTCPGCGNPFKVIQFYPDFVNHHDLIDEAIAEKDFIGYILRKGKNLVGFSWGYKVPEVNTKSVNFDLLRESFSSHGIRNDETFYGAEIGVVGEFQGKGLGAALSYSRLSVAHKRGFEGFVTRTINPAVLSMLEKTFSGKKGREIAKDPERGSYWYLWGFDDFNEDFARSKIERVLSNV